MICPGNEFYQGIFASLQKLHIVVRTIEQMVLCHFLSAPRLMKKVAERIFIAPPKFIMWCHVVATIRCLISLALLFTKLMMSAWCSVSLF